MDRETKEYWDRKFLSLVSKDDIEKLRQETKANFRQWKEEGKANIADWRQEVKADIEQLRKESRGEMDPIREEIKEGLKKIGVETQSILDQLNQATSSLQKIKEVEGLRDQIKKSVEEVALLNGKITEGFKEVKEELGSMLKFSYADLEKKINALEARIKALEKMVLP